MKGNPRSETVVVRSTYVISGAYVLSETMYFPIFGYILSDF